ncbi:hypothetical protein BconGalA64_06590 [Burkholderia contaminans]|nr:hypothetical protein BconGalA64_06590 [Burkholderia contaminans]
MPFDADTETFRQIDALWHQDMRQRILMTAPMKPDRTIVLIERANEGAQHFGHVHLSMGIRQRRSQTAKPPALNYLVTDFKCNVHTKTIAPC